MNKLQKLVGFFLSLGVLGGALTACDKPVDEKACPTVADIDDLYNTPQTDKLKFDFESDYATTNFTTTKTTGINYGKVNLVAVTDGDTANFTTVDGTYMRVRFLGINTPESTAKVEAWGVKASMWMASVFEKAVDFCLVVDADAYGTLDSSGSRALAFVWYKTAADDALHPNQWRLYNLECVEQCYSKNQLFTDSNLHYLDAFLAADERATNCAGRVYGQKDPSFDDSQTVKTVTCYYVRHHFSEIGIDFQEGSSGSYLKITALVVGQMGDNMVVRDIRRDLAQDDDDALECLYVYAGYNTSLASKVHVGDVITFFCRASKYPKTSTNIQLTDVSVNNYGKYKMVVVTPTDPTYSDYISDPLPDDMSPYAPATAPTTRDELSQYYGYYTKLRVQVRTVHRTEIDDDGNEVEVNSYYRETFNSQSGLKTATTIYAYLEGTEDVVCNVRIDATCSPALTAEDFKDGDVWEFKAYLSLYYDNYQIQVFNYDASIGNAVKIR